MTRRMTVAALGLLAAVLLSPASVATHPGHEHDVMFRGAAGSAPEANQAAGNDTTAIQAWLKGYDLAFNAKDLGKLATFYHPDVTIYEGGGINDGWADYRDRHLGPELKAFENLEFGHTDVDVSLLPGGESAFVRSKYFLKAKMGARDIDAAGLATYVLIKDANGWKIRHSHTSSRPRQPAGE